MKAGFDARMIGHPGIGRYIKNLLSAMLIMAEDIDFILYGDPSKLADFRTVKIKEYKAPIYSLNEFLFSPFSKDNLELIHIPHFNVPFGSGRGIEENRHRLVVTIHDIIYMKFAESSSFLKGIAVRPVIKNAVRRADRVIAVSENTKKDLTETFQDVQGIGDKIEVIYEAADPMFKKISDESAKEKIRQKYNLPKDIILYVGSLKRHKNIERLIDAYIDLRRKGIKHRLAIVGRYSPNEKDILKKIGSSDALYLGEVPAQDLVIIYNLATLVVIPSLYEGFGLPVLEAMACGIPVAASSSASLPEVVGDTGLLFNPLDISDMSKKISEIITNETLRRELIDKGLKRAAFFSWEKTARQTLKLYREVLIS